MCTMVHFKSFKFVIFALIWPFECTNNSSSKKVLYHKPLNVSFYSDSCSVLSRSQDFPEEVSPLKARDQCYTTFLKSILFRNKLECWTLAKKNNSPRLIIVIMAGAYLSSSLFIQIFKIQDLIEIFG